MNTEQIIALDLELGLFEGVKVPLAVTLQKLLEASGPSEGFWYFVKFPERWKTIAVRYDDGDVFANMTHPDYWNDYLADELGKAWGLDSYGVRELKDYPYGFPRGRIGKGGDRMAQWFCSWGNNAPAGVPFSKGGVEALFSLSPDHKVKWEVDDHEVASTKEKDGIRRLLGIKEDWASQSLMGESCGPSILKPKPVL